MALAAAVLFCVANSQKVIYRFDMAKKRLKSLITVAQIVNAFGGTFALAQLLECTPTAISNSIKRGALPAKYYVVMIRALNRKGLTAPARLWGQFSMVRKRQAEGHADA